MPAHPPRLYLVTPAMVARACARAGGAGLLATKERPVYASLASDGRRRDWLAGRVAVKRALRAALRERGEAVPAYDSITVTNDASGAPRFSIAGRPDLTERWNVSIAHDDGFAVAALACTARSGRVGVDIERERPLPARLLRYVLTPREKAILDGPGAPAMPALALWALKEAAVKAAAGESPGEVPAMREIELTWRGVARYAARIVRAGAPAARIRATYGTVGSHVIAVATCRRPDTA